MSKRTKDRTQKILEYEKLIHTYTQELKQNTQIKKDLESRNNELSGKIKQLSNTISQLKNNNKELNLTDHAILRYVERKYNTPIDEIKEEILKILNCYDSAIGDTDNWFGFVIKNNSVVTYMGQ